MSDQVVAALLEKAEHSPPAERERLRHCALIMSERMKWELADKWPGLFKLYQKPDGHMVAELDTLLGERLRRLKQGVSAAEEELSSTIKAFEILVFAAMEPSKPEPDITEIPPLRRDAWGISNILKVHEAAMHLYHSTLAARIVFKTLQDTLAPRVKCLLEGSREDRLAMAKQLKKEIGKVIDTFVQIEDPASLAHGNKLRTKEMAAEELIPVRVIEAARQLVEENRALPTKHAVRERLEQTLPQNSKISARSWPRILKDAGLERLPSKPSWQ